MFKLKVQMNLGELHGDDPTARDMAKRLIDGIHLLAEQIAIEKAHVITFEKVACINEQRKDGRNILV